MKWLKRVLIFMVPVLILLAGFLLFYDKIFPPKPNILLICIDTLRADWLSCYDEVQYPTPNIDQLAAQGILFENCISPIPITLPAHFSMFYSLLSHEEKIYNNGDVIRTEKPSLVQIFKANMEEVTTGAIISLGVLKRKFKLDSGFDYYNDSFHPETGLWYRRADEITDEALKWLEGKRLSEIPFFFFVHYSDPHEPYSPPGISPDLEVFLNGESLDKVVLSSGKEYQFLLNLPPGRNEVKFVNLDENGQPLDSSIKIAQSYLNLLRVQPLINVDITYHNFVISNLPKKNRLYLGNPAILEITNNSQREEDILLSFRGRQRRTISQIRDLYGQEVQYCDREIGRLIDRLKQWGMMENLIIILVSDHGEGVGQHDLTGHIDQLYDSLLKVPCIIYSPKLKQKGLRVPQQVGLLDISPTILNIWKIEIPEWMEGKPLLDKKLNLLTLSDDRIFFSETFTPEAKANKFGLRTNRWKLIYTPVSKRWEMYDIEHDIAENRDIYERRKEKKGTIYLIDQLNKEFAHLLDLKHKIGRDKLDKDTLEMLKSLGYIN